MRLILITTLLVASISVFAESEAGKAVRGLLSGDHSNIEHVGPGLFAKIESLPDNCEIKVISGDVSPPIGDGKASDHAVVECSDSEVLGLRLEQLEGGKFRVLGFWSITST